MARDRESRRIQRLTWPVETHLSALDADADDLEVLVASVKADVAGMRNVLMGLLVTFASAAIVGALNLMFGFIGGGP